MPDQTPVGSRGGNPGGPPPALTSSVYQTHLGLVALTWSRTLLGLSLRADVGLSGGGGGGEQVLGFSVRPWLFWKRRGSKRFHLKDNPRHRALDLAWDLTRARFPAGGSPDPTAGFFVALVVDGEMVLAAGDLHEEAYKKTRAQRPISPFARKTPVLVSRREHVVVRGSGAGRTYKTSAVFGGKEREISISLGVEKDKERGRMEPTMWVSVDGKLALHVRRLRWTFRGSEAVEVEGGGRVQVAWDLHKWVFERRDESAPPPPPATPEVVGHAMFVFRFEREVPAAEEAEGKAPEGGRSRKKGGGFDLYKGIVGGYLGKIGRMNRSDSSGGGGERRRERRSSLLKTSSSSSVSSSSSTPSGSTVMEWGSPEEEEMQKGDAFALLVNLWKSC